MVENTCIADDAYPDASRTVFTVRDTIDMYREATKLKDSVISQILGQFGEPFEGLGKLSQLVHLAYVFQ